MNKYVILLSILIILVNSSNFFNNNIIQLTFHESFNDEVKVHYTLQKCLHVALLSTQKYQLFLNLIIHNDSNRCHMEIFMLFATYKPYILIDWHNLFEDHNYCPLMWNVRKENKNQLIMEVNCILEENMLKNRLDNIDQKHFKCIRLWITSDHNEYNTLFMQNFLSEWEKNFFEPKMRHIREVVEVTKTNAKLSEHEIQRSNISQRLQRNIISATTYIPFTWISDYNDSIWNDTESNMTLTNITIVSTKYKNNLIFGYFELYVLILLTIFIILLFITTSIACYYDCENRRITLQGDKYSNIKKGAAPIVTIKHVSKQPDNIHERMIRDKAEELSVHSRTLRKRKMLIAARRSTSTQSVTCSEYGDSTLCEKDRLRQLINQIREKKDLMEHNNAHAVVSQGEEMKSSGESKTGDIPDVSSVSDSKSMKKSVTGSDDMEEDETK